MFRFERGLRPRNRFLGEASEGPAEAPSDRTPQMEALIIALAGYLGLSRQPPGSPSEPPRPFPRQTEVRRRPGNRPFSRP